MENLALFDENGKKIAAVAEGYHFKTSDERKKYIDEGYISINEKELLLYTENTGGDNGTGYVRDSKTGKPVSAPPRIVSKSEKILELKNECSSELEEIKKAMLTAILNGDSELQNDLKNEFAELTAEYKSKLEEVIQDEN